MASFNVLTDPWVPLWIDGAVVPASYVEIITGSKDAPDLRHPRDDFRFFGRMLLSALTQALFPAKNSEELRIRIRTPLALDVVMKRIESVKDDFELLRADGFMQTAGVELSDEDETGKLLLDSKGGGASPLFRPPVEISSLCWGCATMAAYGLQSFAPSGGRGYSPGVRGAPPVTTLVSAGSLRESVWLSTLSLSDAKAFAYAPEPAVPWRQGRSEKTGEEIGLVEGLFWRPRAFAFAVDDDGVCPACGSVGGRLSVPGFKPNSRVAGGTYRHPMTPSYQDMSPKPKKAFWTRNLSSTKPSFTSLLDLLSESRGEGKKGERLARPAPIASQWVERFSDEFPASLIVLDYASDKASIKARRVESHPLSKRLMDPEVGDEIRRWVADCEEVLRITEGHFKEARRKRKASKKDPYGDRKRTAWSDFVASYWHSTEPSFWKAFDVISNAAAPDNVSAARETLRVDVVAVARRLFNEGVAPFESDAANLVQVTRERVKLRGKLDAFLHPEKARERAAKGAIRSGKAVVP